MFEHGWRCRQCGGYYRPSKIARHAAALARAEAAATRRQTVAAREKQATPAHAAGPFSTRTPATSTTAPPPPKRRKKTG